MGDPGTKACAARASAVFLALLVLRVCDGQRKEDAHAEIETRGLTKNREPSLLNVNCYLCPQDTPATSPM